MSLLSFLLELLGGVTIDTIRDLFSRWRRSKNGSRNSNIDNKSQLDVPVDPVIDAQANSFLASYYYDLDYLPLCFIANLYDDIFPYHRKIYCDFNRLPANVQHRVLSKQGICLPVYSGDLYNLCYECLCSYLKQFYASDFEYKEAFMYQNGKYFRKAFDCYGELELKILSDFEQKSCITDILCGVSSNDMPIWQIYDKYRIDICPESECCEILVGVMKYIAFYACPDVELAYEYRIPFRGNKTSETFEDLFLETLFYIYVHLYLPACST